MFLKKEKKNSRSIYQLFLKKKTKNKKKQAFKHFTLNSWLSVNSFWRGLWNDIEKTKAPENTSNWTLRFFFCFVVCLSGAGQMPSSTSLMIYQKSQAVNVLWCQSSMPDKDSSQLAILLHSHRCLSSRQTIPAVPKVTSENNMKLHMVRILLTFGLLPLNRQSRTWPSL